MAGKSMGGNTGGCVGVCLQNMLFSRCPLPLLVYVPCTFDLPLMKALDWAEMFFFNCVTIDTEIFKYIIHHNGQARQILL